MTAAALPLFMVPEPIPALGVCLKVAIVLALAGVVTALMRGRAASIRHLVWASSLAGALALAASTPVVSRVPVVVPVTLSEDAPEAATAVPAARHASGATPAGLTPLALWRDLEVLSTIWVAGALVTGAWFLAGHLALARLVRRASSPGAPTWIRRALPSRRLHGCRILVSADIRGPLACGVLRPVVLVPAGAVTWPTDRLRAALLHELAHVARRDCLVQAVAGVACAMFWFNPLAWLAMARLRAESERACDDRVLAAGLAAPEYAGHLLAVGRERWGMPAPITAAGMARGWDFERRIVAILDTRRARAGMTLRAAVAVLALALLVMTPLAVLRLRIAPRAAVATPARAPDASPAPSLHANDAKSRVTAPRAR